MGAILIGWLLKLVTGNPVSLLWIGGGIFAAGLAIGGGGAWTVQGWRLAAAVAKHEAFVAKVNAIGKAQEAAAKIKDAENKTRMEASNAENARTRGALNIALNSLRLANSGRGNLSAPAPTAASPTRTCFDPAKLDSALRKLDDGVQEIVGIGSGAVIDLDSAKRWVQK